MKTMRLSEDDVYAMRRLYQSLEQVRMAKGSDFEIAEDSAWEAYEDLYGYFQSLAVHAAQQGVFE